MTREEIIEQLDGIVGTYEILIGNGVNSDILDVDDIEAIRECMKIITEKEPKTGHWIDMRCDQCGQVDISKPNYCPNCGAKMPDKEV